MGVESRRTLGRVQRRDPSAAARAYVDEPSALRQAAGDALHGQRDLGQCGTDRGGHAGVSRLMTPAICSALRVSSSEAARLACSVCNWSSVGFTLIALLPQGFHYGIVESRPHFFDHLRAGPGPSAVGQQYNRKASASGYANSTVKFRYSRGARKNRRKVLPRLRRLAGGYPIQPARAAGGRS